MINYNLNSQCWVDSKLLKQEMENSTNLVMNNHGMFSSLFFTT